MQNKKLIKSFFNVLPKRRRWHLILLLIVMVLSSFAELFSFSLLFPFITALTNPDLLFKQPTVKHILDILSIKTNASLQFNLTVVFAVSVLVSMIIRIFSLWASVKISFKMGSDVGNQMFEKTLKQPYKAHVSRNSSEVINGITYKSSQIISGGFLPLITIISNVFLVLSILIPLIYFYPYVTLSMVAFLCAAYLILGRIYSRTLLLNGQILSEFSTTIMKILKESLISIRDVIIDGTQKFYLDAYRRSDNKMKDALSSNQFIGLSPRYFIESISIMLIAICSYLYIVSNGNIAIMLPLLGSFLLAFQRLLPATQQIYNNWAAYVANKPMMEEVLEILTLNNDENLQKQNEKVPEFKSSIELNNINFKYNPNDKYVLTNINTKISKGEKIAIIGGTGNGKSTFVDIIMGLLHPTEGHICVDSVEISNANMRSWQLNIAHVPQTINLVDASIAENIAFGSTLIDKDRIELLAKLFYLDEFVDKKSNSYDQGVGEMGGWLSGGQRQRIGIARALYKDPNVLILDEATSALDNETEEKILDSLFNYKKGMTIIFVTHRLSILSKCDKVFELKDKQLIQIAK